MEQSYLPGAYRHPQPRATGTVLGHLSRDQSYQTRRIQVFYCIYHKVKICSKTNPLGCFYNNRPNCPHERLELIPDQRWRIMRYWDQPWDFFGRNDAKAKTPVLWPPHAKSWLIGKDSDAGKDRGQEEKGTTEGEMAGWHHWLEGRESEWTPGVGDGQGGLACCDSWGHKESDVTERLNWTELNWVVCLELFLWEKI